MITEKHIINYLQAKMDAFQRVQEKYGAEDREAIRLFDEMIACKEMAEALIGQPVNLQKTGVVTVGF